METEILSTACCQSTHDHVLNPRKPLHLRSMLSREMFREGPILLSVSSPWPYPTASPQPVLQKESKLGLMELATKFCLKTKLTYPSLTNMPAELLAGYVLHSQQNAENTFQDFVKLWSIQFCYSNKQIYFLLAKNCTDYNDPYLISLSLVTVA